MTTLALVDTDAPLQPEELRDRYLRSLADLENMRKRTQRQIDDARTQGEEHVARAFLPIVDDMARAMRSLVEANEHTPFNKDEVLAGWQSIFAKFVHTLKTLEIEGFQTEGQRFSAELMEAVVQVPRKDLKAGTVVAQLSSGYTRRGKLLQPATVAVAVPEDEP